MMIRKTIPTISVAFLLVAGTMACEKNPNTEVKSAEAELTSEQRKAQQEDAMLRQKQADEQAAQAAASRDEQAELRRRQESDRAETSAEGRMATSDATKDVTHAHEKMDADRRDFAAKANERLQKLDAKAKELKTKSAKLTAAKKTEFNGNLTRFNTERDTVNAKINALGNVSNESWESAKKDVENKLDALENTVDKMDRGL